MTMTDAEARTTLANLRNRISQLRLAASQKRWKPSEKVLTMASYQREIDALNRALICLAGGNNETQNSSTTGTTKN